MDFSIKQDDTAPSYAPNLIDARPTTWTLAGATVKFNMRRMVDGLLVVDARTCTIEDVATRRVRVDWQAGDTAVAGFYFGEFKVTLSGGQVETFPDDGQLLIKVTARAGATSLPPSLCTVEEVAMGIPDLTAAEATYAAQAIIPRVEREAEAFLQHSLLVAQRTEAAIPLVPGQLEIPLHHSPVRSVASVALDGDVVPAASYVVERNGVVLFWYGNATNLLEPMAASVTYTGGLGVPTTDLIKPALLSRMARLLMKFRDETLGTDSANAERYSVHYLSEGFTDEEMKTLSPYRSVYTGLFTAVQNVGWGAGHVDRAVNWL